MTQQEEVELEKRVARFASARLATEQPDYSPMFRLLTAYALARDIILRSKSGGTPLEEIAATLDRLESMDYEI